MDWIQFTLFVLGNMVFTLTLWLWSRAESRSDNRHMDNKLDSTRELVRAIHDEMKDFHYKLIEIERAKR
jgi:hypothetical protein